MNDDDLPTLLAALDGGRAADAWAAFLDRFGPTILQMVRAVERDDERASDCFLFVCERLVEDRGRRLRRFDHARGVRFTTWLQVVVRRLATDWHRERFGRPRMFRSILALGPLCHDVFAARYRHRLTLEQAFAMLAPRHPGLSWGTLTAADDAVGAALSSRQQWLLASGQPTFERIDAAADEPGAGPALVDAGAGPEAALLDADERRRMARAIAQLPPDDRLLLRLRFTDDLTLSQVARAMGLRDAQSADRRLRRVLAQLRACIQ